MANPSEPPFRILFFTDYFPRPANMTMGTWAMDQALALKKQGCDVLVVSFSTWVPRILAELTGRGRSYAGNPIHYQCGGLEVHAPKWAYIATPFVRSLLSRIPDVEFRLLWALHGKAFLGIVNEFNPHCIFAHHTLPNGYFAYRCHQERSTPYVIADFEYGSITSCRENKRKRDLFGLIKQNAVFNIAASRKMEDDSREIFPTAPGQNDSSRHSLR